ncbi:hypothetical protein PsYK624_076200 [Phanerochaete sordida]|uniref:Uncharacterized protein n=1 Tax=Phanerochaete sordida TaxID=48140 RepID=A0A9P3GCR6_9APHY|nr:hypothetical protein PsYK624_076200 [Phanerochaete sordida]
MPYAYTYAEQLLSRGYGLPLWRPEPTKFGEVQLGDVGFVEDGRFYRLFNVTRPADDPLNRFGVPEGFETLQINEELHRHVEEQYLPPGPVCTTSTTWRKVEVEASAQAPQAQVSAALSYSFTCKGDRGALAVLPDGASQERYVRSRACRAYICAHHASWEAFARAGGWHVHPSELVLVYGCVKASAWALAAYAQRDSAHELAFTLAAGGFVAAHAGAGAGERVAMSMEQRCGPSRPPDQPAPAPRDQCIFLAYYKLKRRGMGAVQLQGAPVLEDVSDVPGSEYLCMPWTCFPLGALQRRIQKRRKAGKSKAIDLEGSNAVVLEDSETPKAFADPLDDVLDYVLEHSGEADTAVVSHEDLYDVFPDNEWPDDIAEYLCKTRPEVVFDDAHGAACMKPRPSTPSPASRPASLPQSRQASIGSVHSQRARSPSQRPGFRNRFLSGASTSRLSHSECAGVLPGSPRSWVSRLSHPGSEASFYTAQSVHHSNSTVAIPLDSPASPPFLVLPENSPRLGTPPQLPAVLEDAQAPRVQARTSSPERFSTMRLRELGIPVGPFQAEGALPQPSATQDWRERKPQRRNSLRRGLTHLFSRVPMCGGPGDFDPLTISPH